MKRQPEKPSAPTSLRSSNMASTANLWTMKRDIDQVLLDSPYDHWQREWFPNKDSEALTFTQISALTFTSRGLCIWGALQFF